jgi:hypothetical protein
MATTRAKKHIPDRATYSGELGRRGNDVRVPLQRQHHLLRRSTADVAAARDAASVVGAAQHGRLRRRRTPEALEALAEQMLRTILALRRAEMAYRAHSRGADAAMLQHLMEADFAADAAGRPAEEHARLAALKKDYLAWLAYVRTRSMCTAPAWTCRFWSRARTRGWRT